MSPSARTRNMVNRWVFVSTKRRRTFWERLSAPQLFVGSFLLLILLGTLGLKGLPGLYAEGKTPLSWLDALFTATSAVCVTGLIVVDTATHFSTAGQAFLLLLIQLGGLGIITFTTLIMAALGRRLSVRTELLSASMTEVTPHLNMLRLTRDVVLFTIALELLGTMILYLLWIPRLGWIGAVWPAFFHAISAFCNAGFSTYSDSLIGFQGASVSLAVISFLIILGGIGFLTLEELWIQARERSRRYRKKEMRQRLFRLSLHSRIVLATTGLLLLSGGILFTILEWNVTLTGMPVVAKFANGWFMSVTARTAGFNAVDYADATAGSNFLTIILMSIGGSPGSTAGGLKTTTFALPALLVLARLRGRDITSIWSRTIPEETIQRAVGLAVGSFALIALSIFVMVAVELAGTAHDRAEAGFLAFMFEAASAFNTVGLSMGITADLSATSKVTLTLLMFLGRVGLPTAAAALTLPSLTPSEDFRYAYEDVMVG